jgi:hypothetical protein
MFRTIANKIAASAAASIITNMAITCPVNPNDPNLEKAIKFMLAEFKINSIPIKTMIVFFLVTTPKRPSEKRMALKIRK